MCKTRIRQRANSRLYYELTPKNMTSGIYKRTKKIIRQKVKDTSNMSKAAIKRHTNGERFGFQKGNRVGEGNHNTKGKHWKIKDTSKMKGHTKENSTRWKGGLNEYKKRHKQKYKERREKLAGRKKPKQCEVCGAFGRICFDHVHDTGKFRGWICNRCNSALGFVKDSPELLRRLADYLEK